MHRTVDDRSCVPVAVDDGNATVDHVVAQLGRRFVDSKVDNGSDAIVVQHRQIASVHCVADEHELGMNFADQVCISMTV